MMQVKDYKVELEQHSSKPLRDGIFHIIKHEIIEGNLLPGDRITEDDLAQKCNCSRTPVREALRKLEQDGFLIVKPGIGMEIAPISFELLKQEFDMRAVLEEFAVSKTCELITADKLKQLEWANEKLIYAIEKQEYVKASRLNYEFHQLIYDYTDNFFMKKFSESLWLSMRITFLNLNGEIGQFNPEWYKNRTNEHIQLIEAFHKRDKKEAVMVIKKHVEENYIQHASFFEAQMI